MEDRKIVDGFSLVTGFGICALCFVSSCLLLANGAIGTCLFLLVLTAAGSGTAAGEFADWQRQ